VSESRESLVARVESVLLLLERTHVGVLLADVLEYLTEEEGL
jgi:hypothetical protein